MNETKYNDNQDSPWIYCGRSKKINSLESFIIISLRKCMTMVGKMKGMVQGKSKSTTARVKPAVNLVQASSLNSSAFLTKYTELNFYQWILDFMI